jgi:hypothetical protein
MTVTRLDLTPEQQRQRDALAERLSGSCLDALDIWGVYLPASAVRGQT